MSSVRTGIDLYKLAVAPSQSEQDAAKRTHENIRRHLESDDSLSRYYIQTRLQGSYRNATNVRADSDVDMSCRTAEIFLPDVTELPDVAASPYDTSPLERYKAALTPGSFTFDEYRRDVYNSLRHEYGATVVDGNKAVKVPGNTYRLDADVLPCIEHRRYFQYTDGSERDFNRGIAFCTKQGEWIVNFPEQHYENLTGKNTATNAHLKSCIRIVKRIRNLMVDDGTWQKQRSPSYYLECLMWNAPTDLYCGSYPQMLFDVLKYLYTDINEKRQRDELSSYVQANRIFVLFHPRFWNADDALAFIDHVWTYVFE